ncbi:MAG: hypothetical protein J6Y78_04240, partial [Paludibacteraceae bacterium]|nr:hypothetical protein [Paludibacteraceae bacterium]
MTDDDNLMTSGIRMTDDDNLMTSGIRMTDDDNLMTSGIRMTSQMMIALIDVDAIIIKIIIDNVLMSAHNI